jgi:nucleoside 2-deoxyribosyltransferase
MLTTQLMGFDLAKASMPDVGSWRAKAENPARPFVPARPPVAAAGAPLPSSRNVYLAGPIAGLTYGECSGWREYARERLRAEGINAYSPLRGKEYLDTVGRLSGDAKQYQHLGVFATSKAIMTRDSFDVRRADVVLVNLLGADRVSIGTMFEIAWAYDRHIPVVCAIEPSGNVHEHLFVQESIGFRTESVDEAISITIAILR